MFKTLFITFLLFNFIAYAQETKDAKNAKDAKQCSPHGPKEIKAIEEISPNIAGVKDSSSQVIDPCKNLLGGVCASSKIKDFHQFTKELTNEIIIGGYNRVLTSLHSDTPEGALKKILKANGFTFRGNVTPEEIKMFLSPSYYNINYRPRAEDVINELRSCSFIPAASEYKSKIEEYKRKISKFANVLPPPYLFEDLTEGERFVSLDMKRDKLNEHIVNSKPFIELYSAGDYSLRHENSPEALAKFKTKLFKYIDYISQLLLKNSEQVIKSYNKLLPRLDEYKITCNLFNALSINADGVLIDCNFALYQSPIFFTTYYSAEGYKRFVEKINKNIRTINTKISKIISSLSAEHLAVVFNEYSQKIEETFSTDYKKRIAEFLGQAISMDEKTKQREKNSFFSALFEEFKKYPPKERNNEIKNNIAYNQFDFYCNLANRYAAQHIKYLIDKFYDSVSISRPMVEYITEEFYGGGKKEKYQDLYNQIKTEVVAVYKEKLEPLIREPEKKKLISKTFSELDLNLPRPVSKVPFKKKLGFSFEVIDYESMEDDIFEEYYALFQDPSLKDFSVVNAYFSPTILVGVKKNKQKVSMLPGLLKIFYDNPIAIQETMAHEIGHTFGPQVSEIMGYPLKKVYHKLFTCFKKATSIHMRKGQEDEAVADWFSAEAIGRMLRKTKNPKPLAVKALTLFCAAYKTTPSLKNEDVNESHPLDIRRINGIFGANPDIRSAFNCKNAGPEYCSP